MRIVRTSLVLLAAITLGSGAPLPAAEPVFEGKTDRPLRYTPDGADFVIRNGPELYNRPLHGRNNGFRIDAGDKPEFSLFLPGRGGNLRLGIRTAAGAKWLNDAEVIEARYRAGSMRYEIRDPLLGPAGAIALVAAPLAKVDGLVVRAEARDLAGPVELLWAFGGANGDRGSRNGDVGAERMPVSEFFALKPEYCQGNKVTLGENGFTLEGKPGTLVGVGPEGSKLVVADAGGWASPGTLWGSASPAVAPIAAGASAMESGKPLFVAVQRSKAAPTTARETDGGNPAITAPKVLATADLPAAFDGAVARTDALAAKLVVETPDPYVNAAAAALCAAGDAVWTAGNGTFAHGGVAWRVSLLGWRGPYLADALGWHDRARANINYWTAKQNIKPIVPVTPHAMASRNLSCDDYASLHSNGDMSGTHYDMNLSFIDVLFRHLLWTGDRDLAKKVWPVIQRHLAWEQRNFRRPFGPDKAPLYEAYCAIWASDDLQYSGGGVTHTTAYNYYHNTMAARVATLIGEDAAPYEAEAAAIRAALKRELWLGDRGWYAENKDLLGKQLVHPAAAVWTVYHSIDSLAADPFEAYQLGRYVDTQIAHIPVKGPGVPEGDYYTMPDTNWLPYYWSTNNVVCAEVGHTALSQWQAGRDEQAFAAFKGNLLDVMFMSIAPGNTPMASYFDAYRRSSQRDFADPTAVNSRALVEGLFGLKPDALAGELVVRPGFPAEWTHATIRHADVTSSYKRDGRTETYNVVPSFPVPMKLRLQIAARGDTPAAVTVNGKPADWRMLEDSVGKPRIEITAEDPKGYEVSVRWDGDAPAVAKAPAIAALGRGVDVSVAPAALVDVFDPQKTLGDVQKKPDGLHATVTGMFGGRTAFAKVRQGALTWWAPVQFDVRPPLELVASAKQDDAGVLKFTVRNNTTEAVDADAAVVVGASDQKDLRGLQTTIRVKAPALGESAGIALPAANASPGSNPVAVDLGGGNRVAGTVVNWSVTKRPDKGPWEPIDLTPVFNDRVTQIFKNEYLSPRSPYCSLAIPKQGIGGWCTYQALPEIDDAGLRAASDANKGTLDVRGIPFRTPGAGDAKNVLFTSQWDNYPKEATVPLSGRAGHAYLLMAGSTNPMQSRIDNGEVVVTYADGTTVRLALENPTTWWPIEQDYFIDDYAFRREGPLPIRVDLRTGQARTPEVAKRGKTAVAGGSATLLDLPLDRGKDLKSVTVRTITNEVVIGLMGVTLDRE